MTVAGIIAAFLFVIFLLRPAGKKMEKIYRLSAAGEAGGADGN